MEDKKGMDRRVFLEKFAKISTAAITIGVCTACPGTPPDYFGVFIDVYDIDGRSYLDWEITQLPKQPKFVLRFSHPVLPDVEKLVDIADANSNTIPCQKSWQNESDLEITFPDDPLNYGSRYILNISDDIKDKNGMTIDGYLQHYIFDITHIKLSSETITLAPNEEVKVEIEALYIDDMILVEYDGVFVEKLSNDYYEENGEADVTVEGQTVIVKGLKEGKMMFGVYILYNGNENKPKTYQTQMYVEIS